MSVRCSVRPSVRLSHPGYTLTFALPLSVTETHSSTHTQTHTHTHACTHTHTHAVKYTRTLKYTQSNMDVHIYMHTHTHTHAHHTPLSHLGSLSLRKLHFMNAQPVLDYLERLCPPPPPHTHSETAKWLASLPI